MKTTPVAMALLWAMAGLGNAPAQAEGQSIDPSKKIILMAGGHRRPDTLLRDLERMEKLGAFDGIAVYPPLALHGARKDVIGRLFRTERHDIEDFGQAIADLQAVHAKATRFKHNFLLAYLTTGSSPSIRPTGSTRNSTRSCTTGRSPPSSANAVV